MTGDTLINGKDLFTVFGMYITNGGYNDLVSFASLKKVTTIDWAEFDGEEVNLDAPVLDTKQVVISFGVLKTGDFTGFITEITTSTYNAFTFNEIGKSFSLRLVSHSTLDLGYENKPFTLSLVFADDFPLSGYTYVLPETTSISQTGYSLDGKSLADYGCAILAGSMAEILKKPDIKLSQYRNINKNTGLYGDSGSSTYDTGKPIKYKAKDVKINCLMRASTKAIFWKNYNALLFDLIRSGERTFVAPGVSNQCYYKSSSVSDFNVNAGVWCEFGLTLRFI